MAFVETERHGQVMVIRMNRPERLNALGQELRTGLAEAWCEFRTATSSKWPCSLGLAVPLRRRT